MCIKLEDIINWRSILIIFFHTTLYVLSIFNPFYGKKTILPNGKESFVANGLFSVIVTLIISFLVNLFYIPIFQIVHDDFVQLFITAQILGLTIATIVYIKGGKTPITQRNPHAVSGNFFNDFWMGRELNPTIFEKIHIKVVLIRLALGGVVKYIKFTFQT